LTTVDAMLVRARARGLDRLDAQLLLCHVLRQSRAWLLAHGDAPVDAALDEAYDALCARRAAGEPHAYLVGEREFHGMTLAVSEAVLVPRPDTETLVDWALALLEGELVSRQRPSVVDFGTGSGAIALALKKGCPRAEVWAAERSPAALAVARGNADRLGLEVQFAEGDWWQALPPGVGPAAFDLVVSNPPYIAADDPHLEALTHEPRTALVAADDGLADIARIAGHAPARMNVGGWLLFEHGWTQADAVVEVLTSAGFSAIETRPDIEGRPRCTGGRLGPQGRNRDDVSRI
jgi:release factor glutamine methyltransferase